MNLVTAAFVVLLQARAPEILEERCLKCHDAQTHKGGLDLSTRESLRAKADLLWKSVAHLDEPFMPYKSPKLPQAELGELKRWLDQGLPLDRPLRARGASATHWAFRPLGAGSLDSLGKGGRPADRRVLLRRVTYDLVGLPPTLEEVEAFLADRSPDAYEKVVDGLLARPAYGERWARHWLDVARYADSSGYESDSDRKTIYAYRDAVIRAMNDDLPFDTFVRWQVAGDELAPDDPAALALTGFLVCGPASDTTPTDTRRNKEKYRMDELDDIVSTTGQAFLGLTVGCARCHDHKYDPISSKEYYGLVADFISISREERPLSPAHRRLEEFLAPRRAALREERIRALEIPEGDREILRQPQSPNNAISSGLYKKHGQAVQATDARLREWLGEPDRATWDALAGAARGTAPRALVAQEGPFVQAWRLGRGDVDLKEEEVPPGVLRVMGQARTRDPRPRVAFGQWLTDVEQGAGALLARVIANRLYAHHFGTGIVGTPNDFGLQGDRPTDPELLEGLARELVEKGWRLKALQRRIVTSPAYRAERRPLRLEAEALRDAILAVSGRLNPEMYGPAVRVRIPAEAIVTRTKDEYPRNIAEGPQTWRRSVYLFLKRSVRVPFLEVNDAPGLSSSCGRRARTTVAPQALTLLNDPWVRDCARALAARAGTPERAFVLALGRPPSTTELGAARTLDLVDFCHVLFTLNEFVYVD